MQLGPGLHDSPLDIAVIGSGIAGLSCAWLLSKRHRVTLYEGADRLGGHTNTLTPSGAPGIAVDAGFIVYNEATYPNFTALLAHLGVASQPSEMSFAVSRHAGALEYAGTDLGGLLAQKANVIRPRFWAMMRDLLRFYRQAPRDIARMEALDLTLDEYLIEGGYGAAFRDDHLLPMAAAIWSTPTAAIGDYPAAAFIRFCANHGLLRVSGRPEWRTVAGGARNYLRWLVDGVSGPIHLARRIGSVARTQDAVRIEDIAGEVAWHDHVVIASHAHQAFAMLADPDERETALLGAFGHTRNLAVLHTDATLMPRRRRVWSSWNFMESGDAGGPPFVTYWMNRLQALPGPCDYFLTLNPPRPPAAGTILHTEQYTHPLFDRAALAAQRDLWSLQGVRRTWFCGAWFGAGFHEDGLQAGLAVAEALGNVRRPWACDDESGRIRLKAKTPVAAGIS
ncbi:MULTISPECIES: NAD(P)/FAD-dependent oxidoreductase [unclassified Acidisoma]|jgi:predicted NAD/FAD-binding protein|uniref:NAD(P)/FAD-dependent oxidoreductase n=1 Tax=unclassified Acidisoma TaxID=2634065 RepID=UPI00131C644F|nr:MULTISPECIES: FAD-dependent oxidoreductase [unclassified Acidisoma]